jgi:hypothetical protein
MAWSRWTRITALLTIGVLAAALVLPVAAFALVGEPVPGAEVFLQQQPGDEPIANTDTDGGSPIAYWLAGEKLVNENCTVSWPGGAVRAGTEITVTVGESSVGEVATDGGRVYRIAKLVPEGATFATPITLALRAPAKVTDPRMYLKNPVSGRFEPVAFSRNGDAYLTSIGHFSIYGIGGDPAPVASVPADSPWSLGLLAVLGAGAVGFAMLRMRREVL